MNCWKCKQPIDTADNYCRRCGAGQGKHVAFYYKHWGVWLLFLLIGPFNLIFVWLSPVISGKFKLVYTIVFMALSAWLGYAFYSAVKNIMDIYSPFLDFTSSYGALGGF
ncbi:MAG: hypothetical protein LBR90_01590 [Elusimicrobiota bacterium]|jgi:hypothetical protein|nr:hypothetical protein [Elusimicrobiota bacterium]